MGRKLLCFQNYPCMVRSFFFSFHFKLCFLDKSSQGVPVRMSVLITLKIYFQI